MSQGKLKSTSSTASYEDGGGEYDEEEMVLKGAKTSDIQEEYTVQAVFGSGGFSTVYTAVDNKGGDMVAIKHIVKFREEPDRMMPWELHKQYLANEVETLLKLRGCLNVVQLYDIYEDAGNIFMVFEFIDGEELFDMICANGYYPENEAILVLRAICNGLKACHDNNVMHRDIKPENIMCPISDTNSHDLTKATIIDFGLAAVLEPGSVKTEASGSPGYVAPEILLGNAYDRSVDMWSLGVTAYILLAGYPPWVEESDVAVEDQIIAGSFEFHSPEWDEVSEYAKDWIRKLLVLEPNRRLTVDEALEHPFLKTKSAPQKTTTVIPSSKPPISTDIPTPAAPNTKPDIEQQQNKAKEQVKDSKPEATKQPQQLPTEPDQKKQQQQVPPEPIQSQPAKPSSATTMTTTTTTTTATATATVTVTATATTTPARTSTPTQPIKPTTTPILQSTSQPPSSSTTKPSTASQPTTEPSATQPTLEPKPTPQAAAAISASAAAPLSPYAPAKPPSSVGKPSSQPGTGKLSSVSAPKSLELSDSQQQQPRLSVSSLPPYVPQCPKCNTVLHVSAKFCVNCRTKIDSTPHTTPPTSGTSTPVRSTSSHAVQTISSPSGVDRRPPSLVKKSIPPKSVLHRYNPIDVTRNIPILREVYDPSTKTGKTVKELIQESYSLSQKAKFPKRGQGKPLRTRQGEPNSARGTGHGFGAGGFSESGSSAGAETMTTTTTTTGGVTVPPELPKYRPIHGYLAKYVKEVQSKTNRPPSVKLGTLTPLPTEGEYFTMENNNNT